MNKDYFKYGLSVLFFYLLIPKAKGNNASTVAPYACSGNAARCAFIVKYHNEVVAACKGSKVLPSVAMVMAIYETANGTNDLSKNAFNFYGIKKGNWTGATYWAYDDCGTKKCEFRKYSSFTESAKDFVNLIMTASRYKKATQAANAYAQIDAIMAGGYASAAYGSQAKLIIKGYDLTYLDKI